MMNTTNKFGVKDRRVAVGLSALLILSYFILLPSAFSQVPFQFAYQGRLTDSNGVPVTSAVMGVFRIIKGGDGVSPVTLPAVEVHIETNAVTPDVNGVFTQMLGAQIGNPVSLMAIADGGDSRWMSVEVDGVELLPRQRLVSVPYAIQAIAGVPPGTILPYGGTNAPPGFLICDGQDYQRTAYTGLYAAIGNAFGAPDGSRFNVPDFRGRFLRGADHMGTVRGDAGRDPEEAGRGAMAAGGNAGNVNRGLGSVQADAIQRHKHTDSGHAHQDRWHGNLTPVTGTGYLGADGNLQGLGVGTGYANLGDPTDSGGGPPRVSQETRPINAYVNYIIKY